MALKKPTPALAASAASDDVLADGWPGFPRLWEFLTSARYDNGDPRQLPTLMLFLHDGRLTAALNDRDNIRTAFVSGDRVEAVLDALEGGLLEDSLGWRPNKPPPSGRRK